MRTLCSPRVCRLLLLVVGVGLWTPQTYAAPPNAKADLLAHFQVRDAKTLKPIEGLRVVPTSVYRDESAPLTWQSQYLKRYASSPAEYSMQRGFDKTVLRVDAAGYLPYVTRILKHGEGNVTFDVRLEPDPGMDGRVLQPDGAPAAGAALAISTWTNEVFVAGGKLRLGHHGELLSQIYETAADGTFHVPREIDPFVLVFAHDTGYAEVTAVEFNAASTVTLKSWGRVEGTYTVGGKPVEGVTINAGSGRGDLQVQLHRDGSATTDAEGRFVIERVPPVSLYIAPRYKVKLPEFQLGDDRAQKPAALVSFNHVWFSGMTDVAPGTTTRISLPREGRSLVGRVALPPEGELNWADLAFEVSIRLRPPSRSFDVGGIVQKQIQAYTAFMETDEGKAFQRDKIAVNRDGTFRIDGLPETMYVLSIRAYEKTALPPRDVRDSLAGYSTRVAVPPADEAHTPVDLGELILKQ